MVETIEEFAEELKSIREEMREKGPDADTKLVASWLERLVMAIEKVAPMLDMMGEEMDVVSEDEGCACECCMPESMQKKKAPMKKAPAKKRK